MLETISSVYGQLPRCLNNKILILSFYQIQANTLLAEVNVQAAFSIAATPVYVQPPVEQQPTQPVETPSNGVDSLTPTQREGLNGYQVALVVIIVVFFVVFIGLLAVIVMQRNSLKRAGGVSSFFF